jgi:hypothetical protein
MGEKSGAGHVHPTAEHKKNAMKRYDRAVKEAKRKAKPGPTLRVA